MDEGVPFAELAGQDLVVDRLYRGGTAAGAGSDPIFRLLPVGNVGGFRVKGSVVNRDVRLLVLYSSGAETDWPDTLDPATGDYSYYGDNRSPGHGLHETPRKGNLLLSLLFEDSRGGPDARRRVPPILLFQKDGTGRDARFRGLLAPGSPRLTSDEELVAVWRTTNERRFQNYRAHFTMLDVGRVSRRWIEQVVAGDPLGDACPRAWRGWVRSRIYEALEAPRTAVVRSRISQLPDPCDAWITDQVHRHFSPAPTRFEHLAREVWMALDANVVEVEVTRPSRDGGRDAVGRYAIGPRHDRVHLQFALEAKCYGSRGVGVREVARLVSRIKHREFGVLVTTSFVGPQAYTEVRDDGHPVVFVTGRDIAEVVTRWGLSSPAVLQDFLDREYPIRAEARTVDVVAADPVLVVEPADQPGHVLAAEHRATPAAARRPPGR